MKRVGHIFDKIADMDNLRTAYIKARRGRQCKTDVIGFTRNIDQNLKKIMARLINYDTGMSNCHYFTVYEPKKRLICAAAFADRVMHHAIINICEHYFEKWLIDNTYACRKGKGIHAALRSAKQFVRRHSWYLKLDVKKYFSSISHQVLMARLQHKFKDQRMLDLFRILIEDYQETPGHGLPIGNLTSQWLANFYLDPLDRYVKETMKCRAYLRYMDDFVLFATNRGELKDCLNNIEAFLEDNLELMLRKNHHLNRCSFGLPFLGYRIFPGKTLIGPVAGKRFRRKYKKYYDKLENGEWNERVFADHVGPLTAYLKHADTIALRNKVFQNN